MIETVFTCMGCGRRHSCFNKQQEFASEPRSRDYFSTDATTPEGWLLIPEPGDDSGYGGQHRTFHLFCPLCLSATHPGPKLALAAGQTEFIERWCEEHKHEDGHDKVCLLCKESK